MNKTLRELGITPGHLKCGKNNLITDVEGVKVGHKTLDNGDIKTGVTAIIPHENNIFKNKLIAATSVINGFGKSVGLTQIDELGTIETPILLTNTLSVGVAQNALIKYMLERNEDVGLKTGTVNPVVGECNDGVLNSIRKLSVEETDVFDALYSCDKDFLQGNVGAGTGMVCYGLKGGIGSSSRVILLDNLEYTIGTLVLSNFGSLEDLMVLGNPVGSKIKSKLKLKSSADKGSIMIIIATDIPLSADQLKRLCKRAQSGIARTGGYTGNGSGEIVIGFSTGNTIPHYPTSDIISIRTINQDRLDMVFKAVVESTEESIINSMLCSYSTIGRDQKEIISLADYHMLLKY